MTLHKNTHKEPASLPPLGVRAVPVAGNFLPASVTEAGAPDVAAPAALSLTCCDSIATETNSGWTP